MPIDPKDAAITFDAFQDYCHSRSGFVNGDAGHNAFDDDVTLAMLALGLAGESGEVCDLLKKVHLHGHAMDREKLKKELGDVLWYIAELAKFAGASLSDIARANIQKNLKRYPNGFESTLSINRKDE